MISRDVILEANDLPVEPLEIPEWGGSAYVRCMTGSEREQFELVIAQEGSTMIRAVAVGLSLCDATGKRLFTDKDFPALSKKNWQVLDRIYAVVKRLSVLTVEEGDRLEKKELDSLNDASGSNSPGSLGVPSKRPSAA